MNNAYRQKRFVLNLRDSYYLNMFISIVVGTKYTLSFPRQEFVSPVFVGHVSKACESQVKCIFCGKSNNKHVTENDKCELRSQLNASILEKVISLCRTNVRLLSRK